MSAAIRQNADFGTQNQSKFLFMNSSNPLVSVIVPTKNSSRTLEACLKSIKNQTYENIELIIVDNDNSTDNTKEIARKYTDKVFNYGPERSAQRNFGAKQAKGEYLFIHDSDVYFDIDSVKECVELSQTENCDAVILPEISIGVGFWVKVKAFERSFYVGNEYMEGARFFKRDIYEKIGGYDENLYAGEDWDLTIRLREGGYKICRANIFIEHDEGRMDLFGSSKKKKYYGSNFFEIYAKKHPEEFKKQMNFFIRFPLDKVIKKGLKHPVLFSCMIFMKGLEYKNSKK
jgi:glycosyltransferase involved in cell wall biosynthesis